LRFYVDLEGLPRLRHYSEARAGIIVLIYLEDLDRIIETEFQEGILCLINKDNYEKYIVKP